MPDSRGFHGCAFTTKNNGAQYFAIYGGQNNFASLSSIFLLNLATKQWETYPNVILPIPISQITGSVALQLDQQGVVAVCLNFYKCHVNNYPIIKNIFKLR